MENRCNTESHVEKVLFCNSHVDHVAPVSLHVIARHAWPLPVLFVEAPHRTAVSGPAPGVLLQKVLP